MADFGQDLAGAGANMLAGRVIDSTLGRNSFIPIPSVYNPNSPNHFGDSQMMQMFHGNPNAWRGYGRRVVANGLDTGLMATPAGVPNMLWRGASGLWNAFTPDRMHIPQQYTSFGNFISSRGQGTPVGTVGGTPADTSSGMAVTPEGTLDPWTGQMTQNGGSPWISPDAFSQYGPYAGGYQFPADSQQQDGGVAIPDFSHYSDPLFQEADEDNNGHLTPNERRDYGTWGGAHSIFGDGTGPRSDFQGTVTNFMANGSNVILGVRPGMGDMNGLMMYNRRDVGG